MHTEGGFEVLEQDLEGRLVWLRVQLVGEKFCGWSVDCAHRMKDLRILSALEVRTVVPSGDLDELASGLTWACSILTTGRF